MKQLIARTLASFMLAVMGLAVTASAQSARVVKVNVPFEFSFGTRVFPAGEYSLVEPLQHVLVLRDARGQTIAQTFTEGVESKSPADFTKLKFNVSGGQYTLAEVWKQYDSAGQRLFPAKDSTSLAKGHSTQTREAVGGSQP